MSHSNDTDSIDWRTIPNASDHVPWHKNKGAIKLNFFLSIIFCGMVLNGYDGTIISRLQALDVWYVDLGNPSLPAIGLLNASGFMSGIIAGPLINYVDDTYGRRWGIRFYAVTMLIGTILGCVAGLPGVNGYALFVAGRVIIGFGMASFLMTSLIVVQEITHPRTRATMAASWDSYWILGSVVASWTVFGTAYISTSWSWRIPYLIQVPMAVYILVGIQFVPETPRFLMANGRESEAFDFFVEYHGNGDREDELVRFEFEEVKAALALEKEAKSAKWRNIVRDKSSLHRLALAALMTFMTSMSGSSIIYYYYTVVLELVGITDTTVQTGIGAGLSMWTWFIQIAAVFVGKRVGKKTILLWIWPCLLVSLAGLCATSGVFANSASGNTSAGIGAVALVWVYLGFFNFANPVLYSYPAEIQTYSLRSKGLLIWNTANQCLGVYVTYVDAIALDKIGYKYYAVYMPLVVIQWLLAYRYMVETHSFTLEEIAHAFGSEQIVVPRLDRLAREQAGVVERTRISDEESKKSVEDRR